MSNWMAWVPAMALAVIAFIGFRRLAVARGLLSPTAAHLASLQVAVACALLAGPVAASGVWCTDGERRCNDCFYHAPTEMAYMLGEECENGMWLFGDIFHGGGDEGVACGEAGVACGMWINE